MHSPRPKNYGQLPNQKTKIRPLKNETWAQAELYLLSHLLITRTGESANLKITPRIIGMGDSEAKPSHSKII